MAVARLRFLDKDEEDFVHAKSVEWLEDIGVMVKSQKIVELLAAEGAVVDKSKGIVKLPEDMIKDAVAKAPKKIMQCGRDPKNDREIPVKTHPLMATTGLAVYTLDMQTGARRPTTNADLANFSRLADAMDAVDICWTTVTASDVPQNALALHSLWTALQNTTKHIHVIPTPRDATEARKLIELASLVAGGEEQLKKRPLFSVVSCPIAPLAFEKASLEGQIEYSKAGIPVISMSMSLSGMSSPVTTCGTIVNINAENLASLTMSQALAPGAPSIYSSESAPIDMTTGVMDYTSHNLPLISAGASQMAKRYGLPSMVANWGIETKNPGVEATFSELMATTLASTSGSDLISGAGSLDSAKGASLEQVVIDSYLWEDIRSFMRSYEISDSTAVTDVVKAVGHGNTFLRHMHTAKNFKNEIIFRDQKKKSWQATMSTKMTPEAKEIAKMILSEHKVPSLDKSTLEKGDRLVDDHVRSIGA
ncbi:MAG: trimethylamine methyltransferase family protein [Candidatus Thermoplasmatota archaeon]|nr:trimethylamine methyltransferase family protein [Candidatus Thermoplasmatota archaeon]